MSVSKIGGIKIADLLACVKSPLYFVTMATKHQRFLTVSFEASPMICGAITEPKTTKNVHKNSSLVAFECDVIMDQDLAVPNFAEKVCTTMHFQTFCFKNFC